MQTMAEKGVTEFYEIGSGKVLAGLAKRIVPEASATTVGTAKEIQDAFTALGR
jgi:[acyl-carrier-protein] S-malonyltransferase